MSFMIDIRACFRELTLLTERTFEVAEGKLHIIRVIGADGPCSQAHIVRETLLDPAAVSRHIDALEKEGLAVRASSAEHRGVRMISLSPSGEAWFAEARRTRARLERRLLRGVSDADMAALTRVLNHVREEAAKMNAEANEEAR